jgi:threonine/homoserine/homoserine lactone efflux protein
LLLNLIYPTLAIILLLTFSFGPAFFALINTGIKEGYKVGSLLAFGIVISDFIVCMLIILLVHYGATNFIQDEKSQRFMGILAGIVLIIFGVVHFRQPDQKNKEATIESSKGPSASSMILKGFLLNSLNPTVWLLWLSNVTLVSKTLEYKVLNMVVYFSITLGLVLLVELAKISAAGKLKKVLTRKTMRVINFITGALLIVSGLVLIYNHFFENT